MRNGIFYLNNIGTRWIILENGKKSKITLQTKNGAVITRTVIYYSSLGNFSTALISYKGRKIAVLTDSVLDD